MVLCLKCDYVHSQFVIMHLVSDSTSVMYGSALGWRSALGSGCG